MILVDANLLIYAYDSDSRLHDRARPWLERTLTRAEPVRLAWVTLLAFLRITTNPRVLARPLSIAEAMGIVDEWLGQPSVATLEPGARYWTILKDLLPAAQIRGPLVMDAHLAALAIEHGATLLSTDRDFARFPGVQVRNPLEG